MASPVWKRRGRDCPIKWQQPISALILLIWVRGVRPFTAVGRPDLLTRSRSLSCSSSLRDLDPLLLQPCPDRPSDLFAVGYPVAFLDSCESFLQFLWQFEGGHVRAGPPAPFRAS